MPLDPPVTTATRPSSNDFKAVFPEDFNALLERAQIKDFVGIKHDIEFGLQGGDQRHVRDGVPGLYAIVLQLLDVDFGTNVQSVHEELPQVRPLHGWHSIPFLEVPTLSRLLWLLDLTFACRGVGGPAWT